MVPANSMKSAEVVNRMANELLGLPLMDGDAQAIAELLDNLSREMDSMRRAQVGERDPATIYDPSFS